MVLIMALTGDLSEKLSDICRLCLKQSDKMSQIFKNSTNTKNMTLLADRITSIARVEVNPSDGLPTGICQNCLRQVDQFHEFRLLVEVSDKALRSCLKNQPICSTTNKSISIEYDANQLEAEVLSENKESSSKKSNNYALVVHTVNGIQVWNICDVAQNEMLLSRVIKDESIPSNKKQITCTPSVDESQSEMKMICELCSESVGTLDNLKDHVTKHCFVDINDKVSSESNQSVKHEINYLDEDEKDPPLIDETELGEPEDDLKLQTKIGSSLLEKCNKCQKSFTKISYKKHYEKCRIKEIQLVCNECGKQFSKKSELRYHKGTHISLPLTCPTCNKKFRNLQSFKMHEKRHTLGSRYNCENCEKSYYTNSELARHVQQHLGRRKFPCHLCDMSFLSKPELNRHFKYHSGVKKFECNLCYKSYYESGHLKVHQKVHTGERPFVCQVCNKGFVTRSKLVRHSKIHK